MIYIVKFSHKDGEWQQVYSSKSKAEQALKDHKSSYEYSGGLILIEIKTPATKAEWLTFINSEFGHYINYQ